MKSPNNEDFQEDQRVILGDVVSRVFLREKCSPILKSIPLKNSHEGVE